MQPLSNPVGQYQPEVLILAPPDNPDDMNLRSLVAQMLEMGIPFELDENWNLPTEPPRDFSAYKTVLIPQTLREKYERDLDAYYRAGGFVYFDKFYPLAGQISQSGFTTSTAAFLFVAWGRDTYFWSVAQYLKEANVTFGDRDFRRTLQNRSNQSILEDFRRAFERSSAPDTPWTSWGDPTYTTMLAHLRLAKLLKDAQWLALVDKCLGRICDAVEMAFADPMKFQELPMQGAASNAFETMGHLLLKRGTELGKREWLDAGVRMVRYFADNVFEKTAGGQDVDRRSVLLYGGEGTTCIPALLWLGKVTGEKRHTEFAERFMRHVCAATHADNGLWHHWKNLATGELGAFWSRMQFWPMTVVTECLEVVEPESSFAEFLRETARKTFAGMQRVQDPDSGLWHLIADDPDSRIESSVAQHGLYAHDRLREMGVLDDRYVEMAERAFSGLKGIYYRTGFAASCRGTACGTYEYYRTRPQGFANHSPFPAALGTRI